MTIRIQKTLGILLLILSTTLVLWLMYGDIIKSPNYIFFAQSGDGLKCTFGSYYHYKYDSSFMVTQSMNYPFGESVFFTDSQLIIVNILKFISRFGFDFSSNLTGILNIWMILTILLGVICVYYVLLELKLPVFFSLIASLIIVFLSPQIERFSGHYNLAYIFIMPFFMLLFLKYYIKPTYLKTFLIALVAFLAMQFHGYYFAFFSIWAFFLLFILYWTNRDRFPLKQSLIHGIIMIVLPFVLFTLVTKDAISDRTAYPWGGIQSSSYLESIFLPGRLNYPGILKFGRSVSYYIGLPCTVIFIILVVNFFKNRRKGIRKPLIEHKVLNALLIGGIVALIYSLVWPFKLKGGWPKEWSLEFLINYMGPLRQFRGTGRFSWIFFYAINVITYYFIWQWYSKDKTRVKYIVVVFILLFSGMEAYLNIKDRGKQFNNVIAEFKDEGNNLPQNQWVKAIHTEEFQSILPLPYFHVGSETFWIDGGRAIEKASFLASWKTGLPLCSVMLSRTSLSQTIKSLQLIFEPLRPFEIIDLYKKDKDVLLLVSKKASIRENEKRYIDYSSLIIQNDEFAYYRLSVDSIIKLQKDYFNKIENKSYKAIALSESDTVEKVDQPIYLHYGENQPAVPSINNAFKFKARKKTTLLDTVLFSDTSKVIISFWMNGMDQDLIPRTRLETRFYRDEKCIKVTNLEIFRNIKYINENGWGLYESEYIPESPGEKIVLKLRNKYTTGQIVCIDELLIRKADNNVVYENDSIDFFNNRYFVKSEILKVGI